MYGLRGDSLDGDAEICPLVYYHESITKSHPCNTPSTIGKDIVYFHNHLLVQRKCRDECTICVVHHAA